MRNLFDPAPLQPLALGDGRRVESILCVCNPSALRRCLQGYVAALLVQYVLAFMAVPFDHIRHRPPLAVVAVMYTLMSVSLRFFLL